MTSWPGAFSQWRKVRLAILAARPLPETSYAGPPGLVIRVPEGIAVITGRGALLLEKVQLAGGRPMEATAFARGHPDFIGSVLS